MHEPLVKSFYQAEDYFFRSLSKECLDFDELTTAYYSGVQLGSDNPFYIRKKLSPVEAILTECDAFYSPKNVPWDVIVTEQFLTEELKQSLKNRGYHFIGKSVAMFIELQKPEYSLNEDQTIQPVSDQLDLWLLPLMGAFELTFEVMQQYANAHQRALINKAHFHHYTLLDKSEPIVSLTLSQQANVARISDVGTLPLYQNKGHASYLMKHAMNEAVKMGSEYCFLEASEAGISVYQKLGFKPLFINHTYSVAK